MMDEDSWRWEQRPTNPQQFDEMMRSLDNHLAGIGKQPNGRDLSAARLVSMRLGLSGTPILGGREPRIPPFGPVDLLARVFDWYSENFGDRMLVDMSPGSIVFCMDNTLWRLRLPRTYGRVPMFLDRNLENAGSSGGGPDRAPASHNLLTSIDNLTKTRALALTNEHLAAIHAAWLRGHVALHWFDRLKNHPLFGQARNDFGASVDSLMRGTWHDARWSTSHCAEKTFKGLLAAKGKKYPRGRDGHGIVALGNMVAADIGARLSTSDLETINSPTSMRYAEVAATMSDAIAAHEALLRVLLALSAGTSNSA